MPKTKKLNKNIKVGLVVAFSLLVGFLGGTQFTSYLGTKEQNQTGSQYPSSALVARIIDGDTVEIDNNKDLSVRLIAINVPDENKEINEQAIDYLTNTLLNQPVTLEYEEGYEKDVYARLNAYVFINDTNINLELVKQGLAKVVIYKKRRAWKYQDQLLEAQTQAQEQKLGLWK